MSAHGTEYALHSGSTHAVITAVGAGLRQLSVAGVSLTPGFRSDVLRPYYSGTVLMPWTNRVRDGVWTYRGRQQQLAVTEPERGNALHGLLCFTPYRPLEHTPAAVTLAAEVYPQHGYPFRLDTRVRYTVADDALHVTHTVVNAGNASAPVGFGAHPFLCLGDVPTGELTLSVAADTHIDVDERLIPVGTSDVRDSRWDLRTGRRVADLDLDDSFTDLHIVDGGSTHRLRAPDGRTVSLWADEQFGYVHVFITRSYRTQAGMTTAVAIEPMTAPADAFNSGAGVRWVEPGSAWSASWMIRYG